MRHGSLPPNPERRFVGARDIALTEAGREQIRQAARALLADCDAANGLPPSAAAVTGQDRHAEMSIGGAPEKGNCQKERPVTMGPVCRSTSSVLIWAAAGKVRGWCRKSFVPGAMPWIFFPMRDYARSRWDCGKA